MPLCMGGGMLGNSRFFSGCSDDFLDTGFRQISADFSSGKQPFNPLRFTI